ncbi:MAG: pseudouridine synthase [Calditrichia bacterium]
MNRGSEIRLNRYLAKCGLGSRRKCDELIASGKIKVNGKVVQEMGVKIDPSKDRVEYEGQVLFPDERMIYILLNKPRHTVTTVKDEKHRKTVLDVVGIEERIFPVGRLDFDTTGALLLTNDGDMAYFLTHPRFEVSKVYRVLLDKRIRAIDLYHFQRGIELDGTKTAPCRAEELRILDNRSYLEVELHEGKNRQIRRMFEALGYQVTELHRIEFAGLKLEGLKEGQWRLLTYSEIKRLKKMVEEFKKREIEQ